MVYVQSAIKFSDLILTCYCQCVNMDFFLFLKMNFAEGKEEVYFEFRFRNGTALWQIAWLV